MSIPAEQIADVLGGQQVLGSRVRSMRELDDIVREGLPKIALDTFITRISATPYRAMAVKLRNKIVPRATYQRVDRFNLQVSETTERMARLYALALSAFEDQGSATRFMMNAHPELDGQAPFDVALTEIGGREVQRTQRGNQSGHNRCPAF